jgi:pimeloyl-ACP methyl ester carboxylesterase
LTQQEEIRVRDRDYRIAVRRRLEPRELVVFLHGLGCSQDNFDGAWSHPAFRPFSLLSFDFVGFGRSEKSEEFSYLLEDHAAVCEEILKRFRKERVHLVAHSMGGAVGLCLGGELFGSLASFVSVEGNLIAEDCRAVSKPASEMPLDEFERSGFAKLRAKLENGPDAHFDFDRTLPMAFRKSAVSLVERSESGVLLERFRELPPERRLYLYGARNGDAPVLNRLADREKVVIPGSGHFPMCDNPGRFYETLAAFLRQSREDDA